jgi:uncharacterized protein YjbJ (UPF0337 family)
VKGKIKETAGKVSNNPNLQAEGNAEKNSFKVEKEVGQIEKVFVQRTFPRTRATLCRADR